MGEPLHRWRITYRGRVQGVGMRPFLYRLAQQYELVGEIRNESIGAVIDVQGTESNLLQFLQVSALGPPAARVEQIDHYELPLAPFDTLQILDSTTGQPGHTDPPADRAPCSDCERELSDPADRRFRYPFLNCSECGPRFTIISRLPYDRSHTSLEPFPLCEECLGEYQNPADRRYHAQVIACPQCGPSLRWQSNCGIVCDGDAAFQAVHAMIRTGRIVAIKGIGGYHLACLASASATVARLRTLKNRGDQPFAVMVSSPGMVREYAVASDAELACLAGPERPIVILPVRQTEAALQLAAAVSPGNPTVGLFLPYSPLHELFADLMPLVMTSANHSGDPLVIDDAEALDQLPSLADGILSHSRQILNRCDDSVVRFQGGQLVLVRRSRGYAPDPLGLPEGGMTVLAIGGDQKATLALAIGRRVYPGPHLGDIRNWRSIQALETAVTHYCQLFSVQPEVIACDAHPGYLSHQWAERYARQNQIELRRIWHHHAHAASWQIDAEIHDRDSLTVCFDGTGYGQDGTIWGGEFFLAKQGQYRRFAHLKPVPLPGGDRTIEHPARMALAHLWAAGLPWSEDLPPVAALSVSERALLRQQLERQLHCPLTSSMGRLFDAVSALLGIRCTISYEAQAAIELEAQADPNHPLRVPFDYTEGEIIVADPGPILSSFSQAMRNGESIPRLAGEFHHAVVRMILHIAELARQRTGTVLVGLTGGVFQNRRLVELLLPVLQHCGFEVRLHRRLPCNDGGLSTGQAVLARSDPLLSCRVE